MKSFKVGKFTISDGGPAFMIAEIGHNHQGSLETALKMLETAALNGVQAVKLQKRNNKALYTEAQYNKPYENENSYGPTYGAHREFLEFDKDQYRQLKKRADELGIVFLSTAFDEDSVDFLEEIGVEAYKTASGDITNLPLLEYIAKLGKPMFVSTGACDLDEIKMAYETIIKFNDKLCLLHCAAGYPAEYHELNLRNLNTFKENFPKALLGYSGHDNGILAPVIAYMLGAVVIEKHFTLNHSWKGTDHKFSLEPDGMRKQMRDLQRVPIALGDHKKVLRPFEHDARKKMGKSLYAAHDLPAGHVLHEKDIHRKSPGDGLPPYKLPAILGKKLKKALKKEELIKLEHVE